jgi:hypothetical protein
MAVQYYSGIAVLEEAQAVVTRDYIPRQSAIGSAVSVSVEGEDRMATIMEWGSDNDLPAMRERLVADNNIVPSLLATRRDITLGNGLMVYRERYEEGSDGKRIRIVDEEPMPEEMRTFFERVDIDRYLRTAAKNLMMHGMVFTEFRRNRGRQVIDMQCLECRHVRAEEMDENGKINHYYWSGKWGHQRDRERSLLKPAKRIPVWNGDNNQGKFMLVTGDDLLTIDEYYYTPYWWGSEEWIRLANCIPAFHQANLDHGYSIRYHIEIPKDYFRGATGPAQTDELRKAAEEAENTARQDFLDRLNKFLAGVEKAGRTVVTEYEINKALGKEFPGIKITPLEIDLQDEALLQLFEKSNQANISAQGIHPTLANIETQGKLSSGSEIRNAFLMYVAIKTPLPRKILLEPLRFLQREMGWDSELHFGFRDMELTRLDDEPRGIRETNQPA